MRRLVLGTSLTLQYILTQTNEQGCFRPLIVSQHHNSLSHVMLRPRPFSSAREYPGNSYRLRQSVRSPTESQIDYQLRSLWLIIPQTCPASFRKYDMLLNTTRSAGVDSFRSGSIVASSWLNLVSNNLLIQSTPDPYVFQLKNIRLAYLQRHE